MKRMIIRNFVNGEKKSVEELGLKDVEIKQCWTLFDEEIMWNSTKFNPFTGKPIEKGVDLEALVLSHGEGVVIEDRGDDWKISGGVFHYYTRFIRLGNTCDILVEYEN